MGKLVLTTVDHMFLGKTTYMPNIISTWTVLISKTERSRFCPKCARSLLACTYYGKVVETGGEARGSMREIKRENTKNLSGQVDPN